MSKANQSQKKIFNLLSGDSLEKDKPKTCTNEKELPKVFFPFHAPNSVSQLKKIPDFDSIMINGFTFIQYRKDSVFHLTKELFYGSTRIQYRDTHEKTLKNIVQEIVEASKKDEHILWIVDTTNYSQQISKLYEKLSLIKKSKNTGVCVRSSVEDIDLRSLEFFDILYFFDMSDKMFDRLRSFISIPDTYIQSIRSGENQQGEPVLVFINYKRLLNSIKINFSTNPFIISCDSSLTSVGMNEKSNSKSRTQTMTKNTFNFTGNTNVGNIGDNNKATMNVNSKVNSDLLAEIEKVHNHLNDIKDENLVHIKNALDAMSNNNEEEAISSFKKYGSSIISIATTVGATLLAEWVKIHVFI